MTTLCLLGQDRTEDDVTHSGLRPIGVGCVCLGLHLGDGSILGILALVLDYDMVGHRLLVLPPW